MIYTMADNDRLSRKSKRLIRKVEEMIAYLKGREMRLLKIKSPATHNEHVSHKFKNLKEESKSLFEMIYDSPDPSTFEFDRLKKMLKQKDMIDAGERSYENENIKVGQEYFDEFVEPNIDRSKES